MVVLGTAILFDCMVDFDVESETVSGGYGMACGRSRSGRDDVDNIKQ